MKTTITFITILFLWDLFTLPVQAQNNPTPNPSGGMQSAFTQWVNLGFDGNESLQQTFEEKVRRYWLFGHDIQMWMFSKQQASEESLTLLPGAGQILVNHSETQDELYAEFDWQNKAEAMLVDVDESTTELVAVLPNTTLGTKTQSEAQKIIMFFDNEGYVYTPYEDDFGRSGFIKTDRGFIGNFLNGVNFELNPAIEAQVTETIDRLIPALARLAIGEGDWIYEFMPREVFYAFINETEERLREVIIDLSLSRFNEIKSLPPLIHFAYIITPTLIRSKYNVEEDPAVCTYFNNPTQFGCTKMTITSGENQGYEFLFDMANRLVHLKDTNGDFAVYSYYRDVRVNIPPATSFRNMIRYHQ